MGQPIISIIIPSFNRANFIRETLDSVINQTFTDWEALVVDDGSTDGTTDIISEYVVKDQRIRFMERGDRTKGANSCRNIGIESSKGKYLIFLDSDDLLAPFCCERRVRYFEEHNQYDFIVFPLLIFKEKINDLNILFNVKTDEPELYRFLRIDTVWITNQPIWKKEAVLSIGGFDEELLCWQDLDLDLRAIDKGLSYQLLLDVEPDCYWRDHSGERITKDSLRSTQLLNSKIKIVEFVIGMYQKTKDPLIKLGLGKLMTTIINSTLRIDDFSKAAELAAYALEKGIVNRFEFSKLEVLIFTHRVGLNKMKGFHILRNIFLGRLRKDNINWARVKFNSN